MPKIIANPRCSLLDEVVNIHVTGLQSNQKVTLKSYTKTDDGEIYEAFVYYEADQSGNINLCRDAAKGGMLTGIYPMGLFWALERSNLNDRKFIRMIKKDVSIPLILDVMLFDSWNNLENLQSQHPLATYKIKKLYKDKKVKRVPIKHGRVRGTLFIPHGKGPYKAVIDMFGSSGGLFEFRASMLASRGFLTLALAIYNYEDLPKFMPSIELEYFEEAVEFMQTLPNSQRGGVGVIGVSLGADIALAMSAYIPGVTCAICINGSHHVSTIPFKYRGFCIEAMAMNLGNAVNKSDDILDLKNCLPFDEDTSKYQIKFHKSNSSVLFLCSEDDGAYPMPLLQRKLKHLIKQSYGGMGRYVFKLYRGAGHLLELPNTPLCDVVYFRLFNSYHYYGGKKLEHAKAQETSWSDILNFFNTSIIPTPKSGL